MSGFIRKDSTMRSKFLLIALGSALAGCQTAGQPDIPAQGVASVNVPVVTSTDYVFDAAAPGGSLAPGEGDRLNGWFQGLGLGYGDTIYVDGGYAPAARSQVAAVAGRYGMLITPGVPMTAGVV
jgi:pilus assembly protein CpaD